MKASAVADKTTFKTDKSNQIFEEAKVRGLRAHMCSVFGSWF